MQRYYEDKVRLHLKPALGRTRLADLTTQHLDRLYRKKLQEGQSPRSARYMHTTISKALHEVEGADLARKNVAQWIKPPKDGHEDKSVLSVADTMLFLEAIHGARMEVLYLLAFTTDLRRGEMLGFEYSDLDLAKGTLKVSRSLDQHYGPAQENVPKTAALPCPAGLPTPVAEALRRRQEEALVLHQTRW